MFKYKGPNVELDKLIVFYKTIERMKNIKNETCKNNNQNSSKQYYLDLKGNRLV
jgi:hypothetical protein